MKKSRYSLTKWALYGAAQYLLTIYGHNESNSIALDIGLSMTWVSIFAILLVASTWSLAYRSHAAKSEPMPLGNSVVPWHLDMACDLVFSTWLLSVGFYVTGAAYLLHTFLTLGVRSAAYKFNRGLVTLVDVDSQCN